MTEDNIKELKREITFSRLTGAIVLKSNCPHCYETGISGIVDGEPVLCSCMQVRPDVLSKQNSGELTQAVN